MKLKQLMQLIRKIQLEDRLFVVFYLSLREYFLKIAIHIEEFDFHILIFAYLLHLIIIIIIKCIIKVKEDQILII